MAVKEPSFTIGIEEEYLLVDRDQGALIAEAPPTLMTECEAEISGNGQVSPEFLQSQVEIGTRVCESIAEVRDDLTRLRRCITRVANRHGLARWRSPPTPSRPGKASTKPTRIATTSWRASIRRWLGAFSSAACTSMSRSRTRTCASTC